MHTARQADANKAELRTGATKPSTRKPAGGIRPDSTSLPAAQRSQPVRVLVVEDDPFVRGGIVCLINGQADLACCGEVGSIAATPTAVATQKPDLVLLDLKLEDGEAFELIQSLQRQSPGVRILVLTQYDERYYAERVLGAGARGYIMKEAATENLLSAMRMVIEGKIYLSPAMTSRLLQKV